MTKQMKQNWIWACTTGTVAMIAIIKLAIEFNKYGVL